MKTTLLSVLITIAALPVCAQLSIGVTGGYSHATQRISDRTFAAQDFASPNPSTFAKTKYTPQWHGGVMADLRLFKGLYIQPQVLISSKGVKEEEERSYQHWVDGTYKTRLIYLEIPLNIVYKFRLGPGKLAVGAGPYFAFPLSGTYKDEGTITDPNHQPVGGFKNDLNIQFDDFVVSTAQGKYYKNSDAGINFIAGYEFKKGLLFNINYSLGLTNVYPKGPEQRKNAYIGVSAGYMFRLWRK
ncbi:outer membrane beta-barrel protein [Chitinophaga sp. SYP-B3965]|uniref:porin family protein n=1 Tax=Chitinophaga sp. SYP-B3965 TaxID=2663120 RepID=UPI0012999A74|nr:porin family protein [Chitinophaga sp. SYP-B3965]MRG43508.1 outer membrane beta-barrel protein [Chitinophaga sp. SYP-B3965]